MWTPEFARNVRSLAIILTFTTTYLLAMTLGSNSALQQAYSMTLFNVVVNQNSSDLIVDFQTSPQVVDVGKTFIVVAKVTNISPNTITFTIKCNSLSSTVLDTNPKLKKVQEFARSSPIRFISLNPREDQMLMDPCSSKYVAVSEGNVVGRATLVLYDDSGISPKYPPLKGEFQFNIQSQP